jgi:hypothetical protein
MTDLIVVCIVKEGLGHPAMHTVGGGTMADVNSNSDMRRIPVCVMKVKSGRLLRCLLSDIDVRVLASLDDLLQEALDLHGAGTMQQDAFWGCGFARPDRARR